MNSTAQQLYVKKFLKSLSPTLHLQGRLDPEPAQQEHSAYEPGPLLALSYSPTAMGFCIKHIADLPSLRDSLLDGSWHNED